MKRSTLSVLLSVLLIASTILASCSPATPPPTPAQPPVEATQPPQAPTQPEAPAATAAAPAAEPTATVPPASAQTGPKSGGRIVYASTEGYYTLDPITAASQSVPHYATFDTLLAVNLDMNSYVGILAEKWEGAPDNLSATLTLRKGPKFQDGTPVDAAAIKWNLDRYNDPKIASPFGGWMTEFVKEVQTPDPQTVVILLKQPYAPLYYQLAQMGMVSPTAYQAEGADAFGMKPVGAGPWIASEITPDVSTLFRRNPDYGWWPSFIENKGPAYPDELLVRYAKDEATMYAQLETGETDIARVPATELANAKSNPNIELNKAIQAGLSYIGFNTQFGPLTNPNVRVAISHAIDRDEILQTGYEGEGIPIYGVLSPSIWGYSQAVEDYAKQTRGYDPEQAKQMLAAEGYKPGSDGIMVGKDGKKLEFKFAFDATTQNKTIAETIQSQLKEVGVSVILTPLEEQAIIDATKAGTHEMILWSFGLSDASILTYLFKSARIGASNRTRFNSPELDKLLEAADGEMNPDIRKQKVEAAMKLLIDQRPHIPLLAEYSYTGYRKDKIAGVKFDKVGGVYLGDAYIIK